MFNLAYTSPSIIPGYLLPLFDRDVVELQVGGWGVASVLVESRPDTGGHLSETILIFVDRALSIQVGRITVEGVAVEPSVSVDPARLSFGCVSLRDQPYIEQIKVRNNTAETVTTDLHLVSDVYSIEETSLAIEGGQTVDLTVEFRAKDYGEFRAEITVLCDGHVTGTIGLVAEVFRYT